MEMRAKKRPIEGEIGIRDSVIISLFVVIFKLNAVFN